MSIKTRKKDILMYNGLLDMATGKIQRQDENEELVPSYIIDEALSYFSCKDEFEKCACIKNFFEVHKSFVAESTKEEWYGTPENED